MTVLKRRDQYLGAEIKIASHDETTFVGFP